MNFIKFIQNIGMIKNLESIGYEENESVDFYVAEQSVSYNNYKIGDLILVKKYKYRNGNWGENHIFLIIEISNYRNSVLYYGMLISSQIHKISYSANLMIKKDYENNLRKDSIIKTDAIYKIFTKNILLKIGNIDKNKVDYYKCFIVRSKGGIL